MAQPNYVNETQVLRRVLADPGRRFKWTKHAVDRMAQRDITQPDIVEVLTNGQVVLAESASKDILWRVRGRNIDGRRLEVIVAVNENTIEIKVVTVF